MKRLFTACTVAIVLAVLPIGCSSSDTTDVSDTPENMETPTPTENDVWIAQKEAAWKAVYDQVVKDVDSKFFPRNIKQENIDTARTAAEKDIAKLKASIVPDRYSPINKVLNEAFPHLQQGYIYLEMGMQANTTSFSQTGQTEFKTASKLFGKARSLMFDMAMKEMAQSQAGQKPDTKKPDAK